MIFAAMNLLAFAFPTVCDVAETLWIDARQAKRGRVRVFEHIRTITAYLVFSDGNTPMITFIQSEPPPEIETTARRLIATWRTDPELPPRQFSH